MTQEKKEELLLKDICARLPYGIICKDDYAKVEGKLVQIGINYDMCLLSDDYGKTEWAYIPNCKPYLFPISSISEEQWREITDIQIQESLKSIDSDNNWMSNTLFSIGELKILDWCYANHIDIHNLIPKGLAEDATDKNVY